MEQISKKEQRTRQLYVVRKQMTLTKDFFEYYCRTATASIFKTVTKGIRIRIRITVYNASVWIVRTTEILNESKILGFERASERHWKNTHLAHFERSRTTAEERQKCDIRGCDRINCQQIWSQSQYGQYPDDLPGHRSIVRVSKNGPKRNGWYCE